MISILPHCSRTPRENFNLTGKKHKMLNNIIRFFLENKLVAYLLLIALGAEARAVTFFNLFDIKKDVPYIIDINDKRHNRYLPGIGQKIVALEFILYFNPNLVIITSPTYANEIKQIFLNLAWLLIFGFYNKPLNFKFKNNNYEKEPLFILCNRFYC